MNDKYGNEVNSLYVLNRCFMRFSHKRHWLCLPEIVRNDGQRVAQIDVLAYNNDTGESVALEIKVTRSDFLKELRTPEKARVWSDVCNKFYFVLSPDILKDGDLDKIPADYGVMVANLNALRVVREARHTEAKTDLVLQRLIDRIIWCPANSNLPVPPSQEPVGIVRRELKDLWKKYWELRDKGPYLFGLGYESRLRETAGGDK